MKAKCDAIEKRETERRAIEEKKHAEEIQFLKRTNQQLKVMRDYTPLYYIALNYRSFEILLVVNRSGLRKVIYAKVMVFPKIFNFAYKPNSNESFKNYD